MTKKHIFLLFTFGHWAALVTAKIDLEYTYDSAFPCGSGWEQAQQVPLFSKEGLGIFIKLCLRV
ncbi:MAG: hypothetical protein Q9M50_00005 [Methylococcales bacterium]|nr:hypothetical protein [Methylococcales bacterium]